jgi:hypothetical protein
MDRYGIWGESIRGGVSGLRLRTQGGDRAWMGNGGESDEERKSYCNDK